MTESDYTRGMRALSEAQKRACAWPSCTSPRSKGDHYCAVHRANVEEGRREYDAAVKRANGEGKC